jgi:hypothetical protein
MRNKALLLAATAAVPCGILAIGVLIHSATEFSDPCLQWGVGRETVSRSPGRASGSFTSPSLLVPRPGGQNPCSQHVRFTSGTKGEALIRLLLIPVGLLIGSVLGILGAMTSSPLPSLVGATILFLESIPLMFSLAPLSIAGGVLLLVAAQRIRSEKRNHTGVSG